MDYGDIIRLIVFGFIFLSFFSGLFGKKGDKKEEQKSKPVRPKQHQPKPARPTELSESGGPALPQPRPRPVIIAEPAGPIEVYTGEVYTGEGVSRTEARREELRERFGDQLQTRQQVEPVAPRERDFRARDMATVERDITDMPAIAEDLHPENRPRRRQAPRRQRQRVQGADILRGWLQDPTTLERAFIVKEVLDRPIALRDDRR